MTQIIGGASSEKDGAHTAGGGTPAGGISLNLCQQSAVLPARPSDGKPTDASKQGSADRPQLQLLQGPPGTGKTFTAAVTAWTRALALMEVMNPPPAGTGGGGRDTVLVVLATNTNAAVRELLKVAIPLL